MIQESEHITKGAVTTNLTTAPFAIGAAAPAFAEGLVLAAPSGALGLRLVAARRSAHATQPL